VPANLDIVVLGRSITSAWGNGHAVTYRGLVRELVRRGHRVLFLEREATWSADHRDLPRPPYGTTARYRDFDDLRARWSDAIRSADVVIVGSGVPDGVAVAHWVLERARGVRAFYDLETPATLAALARGDSESIAAESIPRFDLFLSFTGGPMLQRLEREYGARRARTLYGSADLELYRPTPQPTRWTLGYLGTYSPDRQPRVERLLDAVARRMPRRVFVVAGPRYPANVRWADNVTRIPHLAPREHCVFYGSQRVTLDVTRDDMRKAGWSPSIGLFAAAACRIPIISDGWPGIESLFEPDKEIFLARDTDDVVDVLSDRSPRLEHVGAAARARILAGHSAAHRAVELERYIREAMRMRTRPVLPVLAAP